MQVQPNQSDTAIFQPVVTAEGEFDFSSLPDGTPLRVSPCLIDDLSCGGNRRRNAVRSDGFLTSIKEKGVLQSLCVRPNASNPKRLELCCGYGRRNAALEFGLSDVPVIVMQVNDKESLAIMLAENKERSDVSICDESDLAQSYLSLHDGDYKSASLLLGLSEKVFRERLQLQRCSCSVLDQLADSSSKLSLGHALILSTFDHPTQEKTLSAILANPSIYTVKELKLRAGQRQIPLAKAPFDTTACQSCKHNTGEQLDLLSTEESLSKCSLVTCFNDKAKEWVQTERKAELEEQFGKVILWETKPESDRRNITVKELGEDQVKNGCLNCVSNVAVVDDRPMRWGEYVAEQCIDTTCFTKCSLARQKAEAKVKAKVEAEAKTKADKKPAPVVTPEAQEPVQVNRKTSASVLEDYRQLLRSTSAEVTIPNPHFRMAVALASLCDVSGYKVALSESESSGNNSFNSRVLTFMQLDIEKIQVQMMEAVKFIATESDIGRYNNTDLMISALKANGDGVKEALRAWLPNKKRLGQYNIAQISQICNDAGFTEAFNTAKGENAFSKLLKNRKSEIVDGVIGFAFNWNNYAPDDYLSLVS